MQQAILDDLGYGSLVGIPKRLKELNELLKSAIEAGDGELIADIGKRMHLVKQGKDPQMKEKAAAADA